MRSTNKLLSFYGKKDDLSIIHSFILLTDFSEFPHFPMSMYFIQSGIYHFRYADLSSKNRFENGSNTHQG